MADKLTVKEQRFIDEYLIDFNGAAAARRAGYSENTARQIATENLAKPYIKNEVEKRVKELSMTSEQTVKLMADIARARINDYLITRKVFQTEEIEVPIQKVIQKKREELEFEKEYGSLVQMDAKEAKSFAAMIKSMEREIIRLELKAKKDPKAKILTQSDPKQVEVVELDLVKLQRDKDAGKIKSFKMGKYGPEVEFYAADNMITNLARVHGLFKDNLDVGVKGSVPIEKWIQESQATSDNQ